MSIHRQQPEASHRLDFAQALIVELYKMMLAPLVRRPVETQLADAEKREENMVALVSNWQLWCKEKQQPFIESTVFQATHP